MSRIGKLLIKIPNNVTVNIFKNIINIKGPMGVLTQYINPFIKVNIKEDTILLVNTFLKEKKYKALHGLYRSLVNNMIIGVTEGFKKELELVGVGYKADIKDNLLKLYLGYSHPIFFYLPSEVLVKLTLNKLKNYIISIEGINKQLVGQITAKIRSLRKIEPYKGKGIKFVGEIIIKKSGKDRTA